MTHSSPANADTVQSHAAWLADGLEGPGWRDYVGMAAAELRRIANAPQPPSPANAEADDFAALREVEVEWLSSELARAISNLAYPVGMGIPPHETHIKSAADALFERYAKMIEMARRTGIRAQCVPEGWQLVPVDPTPEMLHASTMQVPTWDDEASRRKWQAMLGAAPSFTSPESQS